MPTPHPRSRCSLDPELNRAPAAATVVAVDGTGHPRHGHHHHSTRGSKSSPTSPSTASPVPCSAIPHHAAVSDLAGVMSPVGFDLSDLGFDPPPRVTDALAPSARRSALVLITVSQPP